jgi:hypothetical protein
MEIWSVRYQVAGSKHSAIEIFEEERHARTFYRGMWNREDVIEQSVKSMRIPFRILSLKNGGTVPADWTVKIRTSGRRRTITVKCGTDDLWNLRRFQNILAKQASVELYDIDLKNYEWRALLGFFAGKKR